MQSTRSYRTARTLFAAISATALLAPMAMAAGPDKDPGHGGRNFDARVAYDVGPIVLATPAQEQHLDALRAQVPELASTFDPRSGVTRSLYNRTGYLTGPQLAATPRATALNFVRSNLGALGIAAADLDGFEVTDEVFTKASGATHIYLRQTLRGIPVYNGQLHVNINRDGRVISVNNAFVSQLAAAANARTPAISGAEAVVAAFDHLGQSVQKPEVLARGFDPQQSMQLAHRGLSFEPIEAKLMWLPVRGDEARLVWNFQVFTLDSQHMFDFTVDALSGQVWTRFDWVSDGDYRVYEQPAESPNHVAPFPPADGRVLVSNPENAAASPNGWFTGGIMQGNNVHACADANANNGCDTPEPSCAGTTCDFSIDLTVAPSASRNAAIANLFYWNNIIHDVQYQYGFDEAGGNFQENNFGNGGNGSDSVNADAQDGSGNCNANFGTPTDGGNPRMQMFTCNNASPSRDGDYDNGVIVHEYGHGISTRQVGGPGNSSCLGNRQQAGEGWSDWLALAYTAEVGDQGTDKRGIGTYLFGEPADGDGIRPQPYSTNPAINNYTYASMNGLSVPHGVGSVWAQVAWEMYWALVDEYGFDADLYNAAGGAGNQRAMLYINEGLKNTACSPTFVNNRDGVIQAAIDNFGGADVCRLWEVFANYGLGTDAVSGGSGSTSPTNGFALPAQCQCSPNAVADAGPDQSISAGSSVTLGTSALPGNSYSWSPGGQTTAQITVSPASTTTYTLTATTTCGSSQDTVTVTVFNGNGPQNATYNAGLGAPSCAIAGSSCDSGSLVDGRNSKGPEPNQPNTLDVCNDGDAGTYHSDESNDRIVVSTLDGTDFTEGQTVRIDATVWAWTTPAQDSLDLYYAADANNPSWTFIGTLNPSTSGPNTLSATYTLPNGSLQAVRANFRYQGSASPCSTGTYDDHDDLVFPVVSAGGNTAPTANITAPANGSTFTQGTSVSFSGTATDSEDGTISGSLSWSSSIDGAIGSGGSFSNASLSLGTHTITASVTDSGGLSDSDSISVTIDPVPNTPPSVTITGPANGTTITEGASLTFTGTATDNEDGSLTGSISWSSSLDGALGNGGSVSATLSVGNHTVTASVTDSGGASDSDSTSVTVNADPGGGCTDCVDWNATGTVSYSNQDISGNVAVEDGGDTIFLQDNTWRRTTQTFTITPDTILEFYFQSTAQGEIHGIGFDEDDTLTNNTRIFQLHGTQTWGSAFQDFNNYSGSAFTSYQIPVGQFYTGTMFLVVVNDNDAGSGNTSRFRNVRVYEPQTGPCSVDEDFESGATGWTTSGSCSTGTFVLGTPTQQTSTIVTQVGGANSGANALFTATNSSAGNADVDGGECVVTSPVFSVANASVMSAAYFHGQRDAGDDAGGDYFVLEMSTNGGATFAPVVSIGDVQTVAAWTNATSNVAAGSSVQLRVRVSDGAGPGDIIEGGIDDVSICDQ